TTVNASPRAAALADHYEQVLRNLSKMIEDASVPQWGATCGDEGWTVAATAQHVGDQLPLEMEYLVAAAEGRPVPDYTCDEINDIGERRAQAQSSGTQAERLRLIRETGSSAPKFVRGPSDEELDRTASLPLGGGASVTTQQLIEGGVLIEQGTAHTESS